MNRNTWHLRANAPMVLWLLAVLAVSLTHRFVPHSRWLLVHLLLLGAASNAIVVWSGHFADALLRTVDDHVHRTRAAVLVVLNLGAVLVVAGVTSGTWPVTLAGAVGVAVAALTHGAVLARRARRALPSRFGATVRYYVAASCALPVGAGLGAVLARTPDDSLHARVLLAHLALNLLGWVGLTVAGTLVTLWPTMLRTRVAEGAERAARRALPVLAGAVVVIAAGSLGGSRVAALAGVSGYLAGLALLARPFVTAARQRPPVGFATLSVAAGCLWLTGTLLALIGVVASAPSWPVAVDRAGALTAPFAAGFAAQVLLGALSYLLPVVLGGRPYAVREATRTLERGGVLRVTLANLALLVAVLPVPSLVKVACSVLVLGSLASFLPLLFAALRQTRLLPRATAPFPTAPPPLRDERPDAGRRRTGLAAVAVAAVVLVIAAAGAADPLALTAAGHPSAAGSVRPTGHTTTVQVRARNMRFSPATVDVPAGDRLVIDLTNADDQVHDLVLDNGATSGRLAPAARASVDVGVVGRNLDGWCSVAGHRQMGMVFAVHVTGLAAASTGHDAMTMPGEGSRAGSARGGPDAALDPAASPGAGFTAYDPVLPPVPPGRVHRVTLTVREVVREVAPGVRQRLWTFGGTAPGPTLHGRVGDTFDVTLVNDGTMGHSVDFHAGSLAPDRAMRTIQPGQSLHVRFTATRSGIWMYHCSTMPMTMHIASGMFGAVVIDPPGLPPVARQYVLVQSEYYFGPQGGTADPAKITAEHPDAVVFNGYADQYDHVPLTARVGQRIRLWVLDAGPDRATAFHVVGGQLDTVFAEGAYLLRPGQGTDGGSQSLALMPSQGGFVELSLPQAGRYPFVSHVMVDAERGAHGYLQVSP